MTVKKGLAFWKGVEYTERRFNEVVRSFGYG